MSPGLKAFGIILYDEPRWIVAIDEAAARILRTPASGLIGRSINDFVPRPDRESLAEVKATFERFGEASGRYVLELDDRSLVSIAYSVRVNAPIPGLNLMALSLSDAEVAGDAVRIRRIGQDVHAGLEASYEERRFRTGSPQQRSGPASVSAADASATLVAAVFPTDQDAWAAFLTMQPKIEARTEIGLSTFDGGWPRDERSVLATRVAAVQVDDIMATIAAFGGSVMIGHGPHGLVG